MSYKEEIQATQRVEEKPSRFVKGTKVHTYIYICPRCRKDINAEHMQTVRCQYCRLYVMVKGAAMEIWE